MPSLGAPIQSTEFKLESGLKIQSFRKDPSKFFVEMESWMRSLAVGKIERMAITGDGAGYLTLVIAYYEKDETAKEMNLIHDTLSLMLELTQNLDKVTALVQSMTQPPVLSDLKPETGVGAGAS